MSQNPSWHDSSGRAGSSQPRGAGFRESFIKIVPDELVPPPPPSIAAALARHQVHKPASRNYDDPYESSRSRDYNSPSSKSSKRDDDRINEDRILQEIYLLKKEVNRLNVELQTVKQEQEKQESTQNLRRDITTLQTEVQTLFAGMSEVSGTEDRVKKTLDKYYDKYDNLKSDVKSMDKDAKHMKEGQRSLEKEIKSLKAELKAYNAIFGDFSQMETKLQKYKDIEQKLSMLPKFQSDLDLFHASRSSVHTLLEKFHQYYDLEKRLQRLVQLERRLTDFGPLEDFSKTLMKMEDTLLKKIQKVERDVSRVEPYDKTKTMKSLEDYIVRMSQKVDRKLSEKIDTLAQKARANQAQIANIESVIGSLKRKADETVSEEPKNKLQKTIEAAQNVDTKTSQESKTNYTTRTFNFEVISEKEMKLSGTFEGKTKTFTANIGDVYFSEFLLDSFLDPRLKSMSHVIVELAVTKEDGKQTEHFVRAWFGKKPKTVRRREIMQGRRLYAHGFFVDDEKTAKVHLLYENTPVCMELKAQFLTVNQVICSNLKELHKRDYEAISYLIGFDQDNKLNIKDAILSEATPISPKEHEVTTTNVPSSDEIVDFNPNEMIVLDAVYDSEQLEPALDGQRKHSDERSAKNSSKSTTESPVKEEMKSTNPKTSTSEISDPKRREDKERSTTGSENSNRSEDIHEEKSSNRDVVRYSKLEPGLRWRPKGFDQSGDAFVNIPREPTDPKDLVPFSALTDSTHLEKAEGTAEAAPTSGDSKNTIVSDAGIREAEAVQSIPEGTESKAEHDNSTIPTVNECSTPAIQQSETFLPTSLTTSPNPVEGNKHEIKEESEKAGNDDAAEVVETLSLQIPVEEDKHKSKDTDVDKMRFEADNNAEMSEAAESDKIEAKSPGKEAVDADVTEAAQNDHIEVVAPGKEVLQDRGEDVAVTTALMLMDAESKSGENVVLAHDDQAPGETCNTSLVDVPSKDFTEGGASDKTMVEVEQKDKDTQLHGESSCTSSTGFGRNETDAETKTVTTEKTDVLKGDSSSVQNEINIPLDHGHSNDQRVENTDVEMLGLETAVLEQENIVESERESPRKTLSDVRDNKESVQIPSTSTVESDDMVSDDVVLALAKAAEELVEGFSDAVQSEVSEEPRSSTVIESLDSSKATSSSIDDKVVSCEKMVEGRLNWTAADKKAYVVLSDGRELDVSSEFIFHNNVDLCFGDDIEVLVRTAEVKLEDAPSVCEVLGVYVGFNKETCPYRKTPLISAEEIEDEETAFVEVKSLNVKGKNGLFLTGKHRGVLVHIPKTALTGRELFDVIRADVTLRPNGVFSFDNVSAIGVKKKLE